MWYHVRDYIIRLTRKLICKLVLESKLPFYLYQFCFLLWDNNHFPNTSYAEQRRRGLNVKPKKKKTNEFVNRNRKQGINFPVEWSEWFDVSYHMCCSSLFKVRISHWRCFTFQRSINWKCTDDITLSHIIHNLHYLVRGCWSLAGDTL